MPFGLTNAPATFQSLIDYAIRPFLDKFAVCYLDDILIFSKTLAEYRKYVRAVLDALYQYKLSVNKEKSEFHVTKTVFLGYEISPGRIRMEPSKVEAIKNWPTPTTVTEVRGFIGFINFYRMFIKGYGDIARPLHALTGKKAEFRWGKEQEDAFRRIKELMVVEPVLVLPDPSKPFEVEANSSDYTIGGQLGQRDENGKLHPMAFFSKKLSGTQLNYPIHDKELLAIVEAFKEWRPYLSGTAKPVKVYTDYKNLRYFTTTKELSGCQIRWAEFLSEFNFEIHYKKGNENARTDALSRRPDHLKEHEAIGATPPLLQAGTDRILKYDPQLVDNPLDILKECCAAFREERAAERFQSAPDPEREEEMPDGVEEKDSKLWYRGKAYIHGADIQREAIKEIHKSKLGGHKGIAKTIAQVRKHYDFPYMLARVKEVVKKCDICNRSKTGRHKPYGLLQPLPIA